IYASTRSQVEHWAAWLTEQGETAAGYHAGMPSATREKVQAEWLAGKKRVVVATNAFGMGIDKPDVRFVIHVQVPASLEAYYQEAGRAGRDGQRSYAVLLYHATDETTQQALMDTSHPTAKQIRAVYDAVCNLAQVPVGAQTEEMLVPSMERVAALTSLSPQTIAQAIELLERQGVWQQFPVRQNQGLIRFLQPADTVRQYVQRLSNQAL